MEGYTYTDVVLVNDNQRTYRGYHEKLVCVSKLRHSAKHNHIKGECISLDSESESLSIYYDVELRYISHMFRKPSQRQHYSKGDLVYVLVTTNYGSVLLLGEVECGDSLSIRRVTDRIVYKHVSRNLIYNPAHFQSHARCRDACEALWGVMKRHAKFMNADVKGLLIKELWRARDEEEWEYY